MIIDDYGFNIYGDKMKHKLSITMEQETILALFDKIRASKGKIKSRSHAIEMAVKKFVETAEVA